MIRRTASSVHTGSTYPKRGSVPETIQIKRLSLSQHDLGHAEDQVDQESISPERGRKTHTDHL